jgi:outer membrane protein assembly factor BamB
VRRAWVAGAAVMWLGAASVTTSQYDNARSGANVTETTLTPRNVNAKQFGKVAVLAVDGDVYAQPLVAPGVEVPGKGAHDLVIVATEHDSVYAFDAGLGSKAPLWHTSLADAQRGVTPIPFRELACPFIRPEVGITSTPVIDAANGTLYVLARTRESTAGGNPHYVQRLHALDLRTGAEKFGGPVVIRASVDGTGAGAQKGTLTFDPLRENPRAALLLVNGALYLTWASSCDVGPYHGWVMAYDARSLEQLAVYVTSPDADDAGIWQGDTGPAADAAGDVFLATGNGAFDVTPRGGRDYGDTILRLSRSGRSIAVRDSFTPYDQARLNAEDGDLGSGGPLLLPDQPGSHRHLLLLGGKGGTFYVIDRDDMGKFHAGSDAHAVQTMQTKGSVFGAAAYWNGHVYVLWSDDVLKDFALRSGRLSAQPVAQAAHEFTDPGATPTISANGSRDGIVWVIESRSWRAPDRPAVLRAYEAANVGHELFDSEQRSERDRAGTALRFTIPTVADGRVFVGAKGEVDVYGLLGLP